MFQLFNMDTISGHHAKSSVRGRRQRSAALVLAIVVINLILVTEFIKPIQSDHIDHHLKKILKRLVKHAPLLLFLKPKKKVKLLPIPVPIPFEITVPNHHHPQIHFGHGLHGHHGGFGLELGGHGGGFGHGGFGHGW